MATKKGNVEVDLNKIILDVDGKPLLDPNGDEQNLGVVVSGFIKWDKTGQHSMKYFNWATKFYNKEPVTMDQEDLSIFRKWLKTSALPAVTQSPILEIIGLE